MDNQRPSISNKGSSRDSIEKQVENFVDSIVQMYTEFQKSHSAQNDKITFILGKTGSTKSTLSNLFADKQLHAKYERGRWTFSGEDLPAEIGNKTIASTTFPTCIRDNREGIELRDCMGFFDTRGTAMEIAFCLFLKDLINSSQGFRIILTIEHHFFISKSLDLVELFNYIQGLFGDYEQLLKGLLIVVTKVPNPHNSEEIVTVQTIQEILEEIVQDNTTLSEATKEILESIAKAPERVSLFHKPEKAGQVDSSAIEDIRVKLRDVSYIPKQGISINVSHKGKGDLVQFAERLRQKMDEEIANLLRYINGVKEAKMKSDSLLDKFDFLKTLLEEMMSLEEKPADSSAGEMEYFKKLARFAQDVTKGDKEAIDDGIAINKLSEYICSLIELFPDTKIDTEKWRLQFKELRTETHFLMSSQLKKETDTQISKIIRKVEEVCQKLIEKSTSFDAFKGLIQQISLRLESHKPAEVLQYFKNLGEFVVNINSQVCNQCEGVDLLVKEDITIIGGFYTWIYNLRYQIQEENKINPQRYHENFKTLKTQLDHIFIPKLESQDDSIKISGHVLDLSIIETLRADLKIIEIYCASTLFIENVRIKKGGLNLIIISPLCKVIGPSLIDISGKDVLDPPEEPNDGSLDALPGKPGYNGGHFLGIFKEIINGKLLTIKANGGRGGPGGHGKKGIKGETGDDGNRDLIFCRDETILVSKRPEKRNVKSVLKDFVTFNGTIIEEYESKGGSGRTGGQGGKGGVGGIGGNPGTVRMIPSGLKDQIKIETKQGKRGINGNPGEGGEGGDGGITYHGVYSEEFILPEFRGKYKNLKNYDPSVPVKVSFVSKVTRYIPHAIGGIVRLVVIPGAFIAGQIVFSAISALENTGWQEKPKEKKDGDEIVRGEKGEQGPAGEGINEENVKLPEPNNHKFNADLIRIFYEKYWEEVSSEKLANIVQRVEF